MDGTEPVDLNRLRELGKSITQSRNVTEPRKHTTSVSPTVLIAA